MMFIHDIKWFDVNWSLLNFLNNNEPKGTLLHIPYSFLTPQTTYFSVVKCGKCFCQPNKTRAVLKQKQYEC